MGFRGFRVRVQGSGSRDPRDPLQELTLYGTQSPASREDWVWGLGSRVWGRLGSSVWRLGSGDWGLGSSLGFGVPEK